MASITGLRTGGSPLLGSSTPMVSAIDSCNGASIALSPTKRSLSILPSILGGRGSSGRVLFSSAGGAGLFLEGKFSRWYSTKA